MRTSRNTDFRSSKNNFRGHDISQGLDREPPSLPPHLLLIRRISVLHLPRQRKKIYHVTGYYLHCNKEC